MAKEETIGNLADTSKFSRCWWTKLLLASLKYARLRDGPHGLSV